VTRTSTGLVFGCGLFVAAVVGLVILNQTLSTQITRQLPQFATDSVLEPLLRTVPNAHHLIVWARELAHAE
jgi:hypothetical protein